MNLPNEAKEIISDMFRWGVIREGSKYFTLDLRTMSDVEAIETICQMDADGLISSDVHANQATHYYLSDELIALFVTENWKNADEPADIEDYIADDMAETTENK